MEKVTSTYGGVYSESTAVRFALENVGVRAAHNGEPLSEAMVFGISGGIGFAYFTFSYKGHIPTLYIGAANRYKTKFGEIMGPFFERTGLQTSVKTSTSPNAAEKHLLQVLQTGQSAIVHVDLGLLPYDVVGRCYIDHALVVTGYNEQEDAFVIADRSGVPLLISREDLRKARQSMTALKHRSCIIEAPAQPIELTQAVQAGIAACCEVLRNPPTPQGNFGFTGMRKWASLINDPKNKSGWPTLFPPGAPLYQALHSMFQWIEILQSGRGALRGLFADYLREASTLLGNPGLAEVAARYDQLARLWTDLAEAALSSDVPLLAETKQLERQKEELFGQRGMDAMDELRRLEDQLKMIRSRAASEFPLDATSSRELQDGLRERIETIILQEEAAIAELERIALG